MDETGAEDPATTVETLLPTTNTMESAIDRILESDLTDPASGGMDLPATLKLGVQPIEGTDMEINRIGISTRSLSVSQDDEGDVELRFKAEW